MFLPGCSPLATTSDLLITNQLLYRLSYASTLFLMRHPQWIPMHPETENSFLSPFHTAFLRRLVIILEKGRNCQDKSPTFFPMDSVL